MRFFSRFMIILLSALALSCDIQGDEEIGLDLQTQTDGFGVYYTDTLTVNTSTVLLDSVVTTSTGYLITGQYTSDRLGKVTAMSFLGVGINDESPSFTETAVYDSLVLFLDYDAYSYGDTTRAQTISVHQLATPLTQTKTYYAFDQAAYTSTAIGSKTFQARPLSPTPLQIKLADQVGKDIFELAKNNQLSASTDLETYLKGLALVPGAADNGSILRFKAASDSTMIRLYYHANRQDTEKATYDFKVSNGSIYFNHFASDRSGTLLSPLQSTFQAISAEYTQEESYIQGGIGLRTRIDIPYLQHLYTLGNFAINKAVLIIQPVAGTYNTAATLPQKISLQEVNGSNWIIDSSTENSVYLQADYINNTRFYSYDLTSYINAVLSDPAPFRKGLLLSLEYTANQNTLQNLVIGSNYNSKYSSKLEIYYTKIQ